ncbi:conserved hypothetical protein [Ricinus communis]|uniref:Uncharacterized protein n=1 Tax=Ricinus communis TaxID=3988 RepID=B9T926_RICCO|nr:conserved hypothetical protein [Ricinus communis]
MPPSRGADRIGVSLGSHRPTVILKLPCLVEKKRTKAFPLAPIPPMPRTLSGPRAIVSCCFHLVVFFLVVDTGKTQPDDVYWLVVRGLLVSAYPKGDAD